MLIVLLREHSLLLTRKLALSESSQLVGLVESGLALTIDGLNREGALSRLLCLRDLLGDWLTRELGGGLLLHGSNSLRGLGLLSGLNSRLRYGSRGLSDFGSRRGFVLIQRLGSLSGSGISE